MQITKNDSISENDFISLYKGWTVEINGEKQRNVSLDELSFPSTDRGDHIEMSCDLSNRYEHASLAIYSIHTCFTVYLNDREIYRYGYEREEKNKLVGYGFHKVPLPPQYEGKCVRIDMIVTEDDAFTTIDAPRLCNMDTYYYSYIYSKRMPLAINVFLVVFGVISAVISIALSGVNKKALPLFFISLFSVGVGCWSMANYNLFHLFNSSLLVKTYFEYSSLYLSPMFILLYFKTQAFSGGGIRKKVYYVLLVGYSIYLACAFGGQILNLVHFPDFLTACHLMMVTVILFILISTATDIFRHKNNKSMLLCGMIILFIYSASDVFRFYYTKYLNPSWFYNYQNQLCLGFFVFVISMVADYIQDITHSMYKAAETETLEKIAYTDSLTGLSNRRKCENIFDEIDHDNCDYTVFVFDLNHLKKVNDTKGHEEGDRYISAFGNVLNDVFGKYGTVGRTGGDEFLVIIKDTLSVLPDELIRQMNEKIKIRNIQNADWNMSTAYGYCSASENKFENIRKAYKEADSRMYENKTEMKKLQ